MENFSPFQCEKKWQIRPKSVENHLGQGRTFFHCDLDAFFAAVEQIKNPNLRGKPVIVGGRSVRRGVVTAASYEAKRCGVDAGMTWSHAKQLCPEAICLSADFESYSMYSDWVRKILEKMAPVVAPASVDEAYLDMTGCEKMYGTFLGAAEKIRSEIFKRTGLSASIGIASTHSIAKLASKMAKPAGILEVPVGSETSFLSPLPIEAMPGIGSKLGEALQSMGIETLGQLARLEPKLLQDRFGVYGTFLIAKARGHDNGELEITEIVKSIGKEMTLERNTTDPKFLQARLFELVEMVGRRLREEKLFTQVVRVKIRTHDFAPESASKTLRDPTDFDRVLFQTATDLLKPLLVAKKPVRLIGFTAADLTATTPQLDLFRYPKSHRWARFYSSVDQVRKKFGKESLFFWR